MSCNSCGGNRYENDHCIKDVVRDIVRAQHKAVEAAEDTCLTGCDQSIDDLLSPSRDDRDRLRHTTIPFILYNKGDNKPFIGSGIHRGRRNSFECVESPIFRAKSFVGYDENCVRLELLSPVKEDRDDDDRDYDRDYDSDYDRDRGRGRDDDDCNSDTVCDFFPDRRVRDLRATGICITVDLNCFCGISCLDATTPLRPRDRHRD